MIETSLQSRLEDLPLVFDTPHEVVDRYLWVEGCELNVKLREGALKLKRLLQRAPDGIEEWLEDEEENHVFPVPRDALGELERALGVTPEGLGTAPVANEKELLERLGLAFPDVRVLAVEKIRWLRAVPEAGTALVEIAHITHPQDVGSVAVEALDAELVRAVLARFGLRGALHPASYLDALRVWARGGTVGGETRG